VLEYPLGMRGACPRLQAIQAAMGFLPGEDGFFGKHAMVACTLPRAHIGQGSHGVQAARGGGGAMGEGGGAGGKSRHSETGCTGWLGLA
jgi:hypothetical protein